MAPDKVIEVQALAGDSTDNVPGVPGIGVKTAAQLINEYGDLENLLAHAGEIKQPKRRENLIDNAEMARISRELVRAQDDVPVAEPLEDVHAASEPEPDVLLGFLSSRSSDSLLARVRARARPRSGRSGRSRTETRQQVHGPHRRPPARPSYELVQDDGGAAALDRRGDARTASSRSTPRPPRSTRMRAELVGVSLALSSRRGAAPAISRSAMSRPARRARSTLRRREARGASGGREPTADRPCARGGAEAAAGGPGGAQGRPQHQVRHARCWRRYGVAHRAARRHHAAVLRARRRQRTATGMDELAELYLGAHDDHLRGGHRHRQGRRSASTRCRWSAPATMPPRTPTSPSALWRHAEAAPGRRAHDRDLRDARAAAGAGAGGDGAGRHQGRPGRR